MRFFIFMILWLWTVKTPVKLLATEKRRKSNPILMFMTDESLGGSLTTRFSSDLSDMGFSYEDWTITVEKYLLTRCFFKERCQRRQMLPSSVWMLHAGNPHCHIANPTPWLNCLVSQLYSDFRFQLKMDLCYTHIMLLLLFRYWPYLNKVAEGLPELLPLTEMRPFLSVMHAKAHTAKCEVHAITLSGMAVAIGK